MKVGIIGASFAHAAYLPALRHVDGAEVVAIASGRLSQRAGRGGGVRRPARLRRLAGDARRARARPRLHRDAHRAARAADAGGAGEGRACALREAHRDGRGRGARRCWDAAEARGPRPHDRPRTALQPEPRADRGDDRERAIWARSGTSTSPTSATRWADPASRPKGDWWSLRAIRAAAASARTAAIRSTCCAGGWARSRWVTGAAPVMVPGRVGQGDGRGVDGDRRRRVLVHAEHGSRARSRRSSCRASPRTTSAT